ncbi:MULTISPECIES: ABC transporter ATP-binding protein/permease [unclassified Rhizobium]|uniref:ABC transporter ATP-binding protein/permease n=1 Tax=unclassified Rhizobium TaxID=2613769 RepID=UPI001ADAE5ED|nr:MULTISPECIES: ABC transporter ATP-binding protein/permease [unclassified Rhizobium]MBO9100230.1 ABC transporter ATP-binding protein/permease [Rhizobium sp. L58/93]MBO9135613.1 ABC transporter ATP-binding protein/permease [Rhizobium sp. B209b/85]MBO9170196.1 ABC transporter ATP-binding protein/permease [Rhizobium sp. L245/93]MBO9186123.1 ABC transporter ATP-binding protein/permease [Rhizobium sp. E27B/91]QXZ83049.1 ABC transporter ATP-binding protein/permease [Rhizobium sp. K1/93]
MAVDTTEKPSVQGDARVGYDLSVLYRLRMMLSAFWHSPVRVRLISLVVSLFVIILVTAYVQVLLNEWNAPFYDSLARRDLNEFVKQLGVFGMIAGTLLVLNVIQAWLNQMAALYMREGLARDLVDQWLKGKRALRLASSGLIGVNPDQRLHEDARNLAESTTGLAIGLVQSTILLISFIGVLWELSSGFIFHFRGSSFSIPGYMVWAAIIYAASASFLSQFVGGKLVRLNADRYSKEAELRFALMHANEYMPSITIAGGQENERRRINGDISSVLGVIRKLAIANTNLTWVSASYGWMVLVIPILVAAPAYFSGGLSIGQLMMVVGAFNQVNTALRWYVANFGPIAEWRATLMRVTDFREAVVEMDIEDHLPNMIDVARAAPGMMVLKDLEVSTKMSDEIVENGFRIREGTVTITAGEHIMINGDHGVNRKLLFQALAGEWHCGKGEIDLPPPEDMLFMPHTAYVPSGTLREAMTFPEARDAYPDSDLEMAIEKAGLGRLKGKLDTNARWDRMLDTDEQKAVGFAHALLAKPRWLILDETLEGLEPDIQKRLVALLGELKDTTMIYIGRSEAYLELMSPRVLHLQALVPPDPTAPPAKPVSGAARGQNPARRPIVRKETVRPA